MKLLQKIATNYGNEIIGYHYIFDYDITVSTDINGDMCDYSGCGYDKAFKLLRAWN